MSNYLDTHEKKDCNGCGVCALKCPKNAIKMIEDSEGFLYPFIDKTKCIDCGLCKKNCSNVVNDVGNSLYAYVAINKNLKQIINSTSGGIFPLLVKSILSKKGVVFGAIYDDELNVKHAHYDSLKECKKFSGSKYVRSDLNNSFEEVLKFLKQDRYVLFSGTPCQCYALKKYLNFDYDKLLICDIFCHSNPSPKVYKTYLKAVEEKYNKKLQKMYFRGNKDLNIKHSYLEFEDKSIYDTRLFNELFLNMLISRPSCSSCKFRSLNRYSDITLGDYWGNKEFVTELDIKNGVSLVSINTKKGQIFFDSIKDKMIFKDIDMIKDYKYNFTKEKKMHKKRSEFFLKIKNGKINSKNIIRKMKKYKNSLIHKVFLKMKKRKNV